MRLIAVVAVLLAAPVGHAQVVFRGTSTSLTVEGWANGAWAVGDGTQADGAVRALALWQTPALGRIGIRGVVEGLAGETDDFGVGERTFIWTGGLGRLEYGQRQGLPDVLTGYAPNPFTFTTAEFGPASGLSLDPAGGLVSRFAPRQSAARLDALGLLGYGPAAFADRSRKLLYVSPKSGGWLAGASWSGEAELLQTGLVHETYRGQNVLRTGVSWTHGAALAGRDSWYGGVSVDLDQTLMLGVGATWNDGPLDERGVTTSINWNRGRWTVGGYLQEARGRAAADAPREELQSAEAGFSWRSSTKLRLYLAWHHYRLRGAADTAADDDLLIAGLRMTL